MSNTVAESDNAAVSLLEQEYAVARKRMDEAESRVRVCESNLSVAQSLLHIETQVVADLVAALRLLTDGARP